MYGWVGLIPPKKYTGPGTKTKGAYFYLQVLASFGNAFYTNTKSPRAPSYSKRKQNVNLAPQQGLWWCCPLPPKSVALIQIRPPGAFYKWFYNHARRLRLENYFV